MSGLYPLNEEKAAKYQDSIPIISEPSDLYFFENRTNGLDKVRANDWI
jgi:hypothetical protein